MLGTLLSLVRARILDSTSRALITLALFLGMCHIESLERCASLSHADSPRVLHSGLIPHKLFKICFLMLQWNLLARARPSHRTFPLGSVSPLPFVPSCIHAYRQPVCEHILYAWPLALGILALAPSITTFSGPREEAWLPVQQERRPIGPCTLPLLLIHQIGLQVCVFLFL